MKILISVAFAALAASPAASEPPAAGSAAQTGTSDPNEVVCRRIHDSGSRLASSRICMTRAQWVDYQRQQRADTEVSQQRRVAPR